jgi:uncharacterized ion transporter superfamily protein YfcC
VIGVAVYKAGAENSVKSRNLIIAAGTFIYGFFGVAVGFENNIALVPIGVLIATAIGCSRLVGVVMAVGGIGIGFALSPINPYTVGVAQGIGELPTFSGWWLRTLMVLTCLATLSVFICRYVTRVDYQDDQPAELTKQLKDYTLTRSNLITPGHLRDRPGDHAGGGLYPWLVHQRDRRHVPAYGDCDRVCQWPGSQ